MITPVSYRYYQNNYQINNNKTSPSFKAHPQFYELKKGFDITASNFFRRGLSYSNPSTEYVDINYLFRRIFKNDSSKPKKMLVIGIGSSQEPFSYLASIKEIIGNKPLAETVELYTVDMQSKPSNTKLFWDSFYDCGYGAPPVFARTSFVMDFSRKNPHKNRTYRVNDEIYDFLKNTYNDSKKSKWDVRIQDIIEEYPDKYFDIISSNNTLGYIIERKELDKTFSNIYRILHPEGVFITDNYRLKTNFPPQNNCNLEQIYDGIYKCK